ncbi:MAG: bifunctional 3,4-dihydroxy-2-butanone 4-phosphate synthase/GTP cyclohydrolase II [Deltaproteobacteria bacterium RIFCSPLOWO2_02_56_12]|nr:MAG: bifunctional 3,4-dihydroxy-2-butanone 4-phosphate synthase/GTP cyclohydrolase II [Deltaproteobacteria bacterium RBG_16_55_12]OGQ52844.1 MAG: bifunctional 3,4-dihydroxy-2-butanone 4-phosphate synthase/GTP cyclohydrolase II [Deltaproteobacteria bacterium RIFCSPLOWO2_02_56_12]OGQ61100.1 MAG: bifunctional 3,4-dihydroxy-2-butanone 4-phosphate synthase/GTP cyclohydrolase II [Deltaproteobacteria bacterium RIFCSPLOWO2_12_55_13]HBA39530.1 3,4-dihydroxy-2-butanone-4-phosphate synthase [Deltaproteo
MPIAPIEDAIEDIRQGRMVVLMDDKNRENEGDLCMAAEKVTPEAINFMARFGRGLICLPLTEEKVRQLGLPMMVAENTSPFGTAFTVSIDAAEGITTGISAADRARSIQVAIADDAVAEDLVTPGHVFPLRAKKGGVLVRAGQTEGSVDLARLAGLKPAGVICEVMKDDGSMARLPDIEKFATHHRLKVITIADLIKYRMSNDCLVYRIASARLPTRIGGEFQAVVYNTHVDQSEHLALVKGEISPNEDTLVRVHSKYVPGDVFGFEFLNTGAVIKHSMEMIAREGKGVILYLQTEGKGLRPGRMTYPKVDGRKKKDMNRSFVYQSDFREYGIGAQILRDLGVRKMRLLTNNRKNLVGLSGYGLEVTALIPFPWQVPFTKQAGRKQRKG